MTKPIKVLYAEDEIDIRDNVAAILESEGFEVIEVSNGQEGIEKFLEHNPDIVVSDIMMPKSSGYDFLKSVRENTNTNHNIPFILLSALGQKEDIIKGLRLGASDYLTKPVDFDLLIAKIKGKANNVKKNKEVQIKNINNLKNQVTSFIPDEMLQHINLISKISGTLKEEIYGSLPKQYLDDIHKIYFHSLKLKTIVNNFLSGDDVANQIDLNDEIINPVESLQNLVNALNKAIQLQISIEQHNEKIPTIKINKTVFLEVARKTLACILNLGNNGKINISFVTDHLNNVAVIFYQNIKITQDDLRGKITKAVSHEILNSQGLELETFSHDDNANIVITIPNYRVV